MQVMSGMFEVASILNRRNDKNGNHQYLIEWKGYSKDDATWEPLDSLQSIKNLVKQYDDKFDSPHKEQKANSYHTSKKSCLREKIQQKKKSKKQGRPNIKIQPSDRLSLIVQNQVSSQEYTVYDQRNGKPRKPKSQQKQISGITKSQSSVVFSKKLMERLKNMQKAPQAEQQKALKKIIDVQNDQNEESVEVLKIVYKQGYNKKMFEVRIGDRISEMDLPHLKLKHPKALCDFYQRIFRIDM